MLNLSKHRIDDKLNRTKYKSFSMVKDYRANKIFARTLTVSFILLFICLFLPWTQNIRSNGFVTTQNPSQRPQTINSVIPGKIEKWLVKEGDFVNQGDTILFISEIKDNYFDPNLLSRTEDQIKSKELTVESYMEKVKSLDFQVDALLKTKELKLEQAANYLQQSILKIQSDSIAVQAAASDLDISEKQLIRTQQLYEDGLKSLTDLETKKQKVQETKSYLIAAKNKLLTSKNDYINAKIEINSIESQYRDKISKAESDKYTAMSSMYDAEAIVTKMQGQYMNYSMRTGFYCIKAPITGYITKAFRMGIGETIKTGEALVSIMPSVYDLAVAMFVEPLDIPLLIKGEKVRIMFDGWPTIVFSGWPNASYGTFGGKIISIDNIISDNGKYRVLIAPDTNEQDWPNEIRVGSGAHAITLLNNVPIWYELWRNLNGFPPDYYKTDKSTKKQKS